MGHTPQIFKTFWARPTVIAMGAALVLGGCMTAPGYSENEQSIVDSLDGGLYQPASRQSRDNIETQTLLSQAAFWGREYELNPGDLESAIKLAAAVRKLGNPGRAVEIAQTARALYPRDPYLSAEFAAALIASERGEEAKKTLSDALRRTPQYARLWSLMGAALDQGEQYAEARKYYNRALQITPNDPNILANLGLSYALAGDPATAETWLRRAAANPNAGAGVQQNLALVLELQGKTPQIDTIAASSRIAPPKSAPPNPYGAPTGYINDLETTRRTDRFATRNDPKNGGPALPRGQQNRNGLAGATQPRISYDQYQNQGANAQGLNMQGSNTQGMTSASDYARAAARRAKGRKVRVPMGEAAPQSSLLSPMSAQQPGYAQQGYAQNNQAQPYQGPSNPMTKNQNPQYIPPGYNAQTSAQPAPRTRGAARRR